MPITPVSESPTGVYQAPAYEQPSRTVVITNTDTVNPVYYSDSPGTIDNRSAFIEPLGTETFDGVDDVWMSTLNQNISVNVQLKIGSHSYLPGQIAINGGTIDATITNASIDANITNSVLDVAVQGTADVSVTGTANVDITGQSLKLDVSAATVDITPVAGYINPGQTAQLLLDASTHTMTPGSSFGYTAINVSQYTSLNLSCNGVSPSQASAGAALVMPLELAWYDDSGLSEQVFVETVFFYLDPSTGTLLQASIPVHAAYLVLTAINIGTAGNASIANMVVTGSFRSVPYTVYRQAPTANFKCNGVTITSLTNPVTVGYEFSGNLGMIAQSAPGTGLKAYPLPLYSGSVWIQYAITTAALVNAPTIVDLSFCNSGGLAAGTGQAGVVWSGPNTAGNSYQGMINLPRSPCALVLNPASTSDVQFSAVGQQGM